jgi:hypothetical protein
MSRTYGILAPISFTVDQIANGAKALLDEVATGKVTGEEEYWSRTDLYDFAANVDGARVAWQGLRPILTKRDKTLDAELESDRARIDARLREGAARWAPLIASFKPDRWTGTLDYTTMRGTAASLPFAATLAHVFNHGTHHRGQITAALTALGQPCPELDFVYFLQNPTKP